MDNEFLNWDIVEHKNFNKRIISSFPFIMICSAIGGIVVLKGSSWEGAFLFSLFIFIAVLARMWKTEKIFITHVEFHTNRVEIIYKSELKEFLLEGNISEFSFKKKMAFSRSRTPYLVIYFNNESILKQYETGEWKEKKFDELMRRFDLLKGGGYYSPL